MNYQNEKSLCVISSNELRKIIAYVEQYGLIQIIILFLVYKFYLLLLFF